MEDRYQAPFLSSPLVADCQANRPPNLRYRRPIHCHRPIRYRDRDHDQDHDLPIRVRRHDVALAPQPAIQTISGIVNSSQVKM